MGKFASKCDNGIFLWYSETLKTYRVYESRTLIVEEVIHVKFNNTNADKELLEADESFAYLRLDDGIKNFVSSSYNTKIAASNPPLDSPQEEIREPTGHNMRKNHPESQIIGDLTKQIPN